MNNLDHKLWWRSSIAAGVLAAVAVAFVAWRNSDFEFGKRHLTDAQIEAVFQRRQQEVKKWAWLNTANPVQMARQDIEHKRFRFLQVCGYSCETAGMDDLHIDQCYPGVAREAVAPMGDAGLLPAAIALQQKADAIATVYNRRMVAYLDAHGMRQCARPSEAGP